MVQERVWLDSPSLEATGQDSEDTVRGWGIQG